jgi:hypothetical protein
MGEKCRQGKIRPFGEEITETKVRNQKHVLGSSPLKMVSAARKLNTIERCENKLAVSATLEGLRPQTRRLSWFESR